MSNHPCSDSSTGAPDAYATQTVIERNRYFTGKYMTARDFRTDPDYFLNRHRLHQRLLHGWGVVYGLHVKRHRDPQCANRWVMIEPGMAIDCFGRELVLQETICIDLHAEQEGKLLQDSGSFLICLRYIETQVEYVPALYSDDSGDPTHKEANRVREGTCWEIIPLSEGVACWPVQDDDCAKPPKDDCDSPMAEPLNPADKTTWPCRGMVPLAMIQFINNGSGQSLLRVDTHGRRRLAAAPENLTHIVKINWPHGGQLTLTELRNLEGKLTVHFDRKLLLPEDNTRTAQGINQRTFVVQYGGVQKALEFLDGEVVQPEDALHTATFIIKEELLNQPQKSAYNTIIAYNTIHVTLKCDFILDCHGEPVDGNFLAGQLPSGNGTPGGIFESWFEVVP